MNMLSRIFVDRPKRSITLTLSATGVVALIVGFLIGGGNSTIGSLFLLAGSFLLILACLYRWQEVKTFKYLTFFSMAGFFVFAILHNVFDYFSGSMGGTGILKQAFVALSVACFLLAILACPAAVVAGVMGWNRRWWDSK